MVIYLVGKILSDFITMSLHYTMKPRDKKLPMNAFLQNQIIDSCKLLPLA